MRAILSYFIAILILASLAAAGGAWLPGSSHVRLEIPAGQEPLAFLADFQRQLAAEPPLEARTCAIPNREAECTPFDFRKVAVERPDHLLVPDNPASAEDWRPLVERYFAPDDVEQALKIISCESGGDPQAANPTSSARGLFQHLGSAWKNRTEKAGWGGSDIFDPIANTAVAAWLVYQGGGWSHWAASGHCW